MGPQVSSPASPPRAAPGTLTLIPLFRPKQGTQPRSASQRAGNAAGSPFPSSRPQGTPSKVPLAMLLLPGTQGPLAEHPGGLHPAHRQPCCHGEDFRATGDTKEMALSRARWDAALMMMMRRAGSRLALCPPFLQESWEKSIIKATSTGWGAQRLPGWSKEHPQPSSAGFCSPQGDAASQEPPMSQRSQH